MPQVIRGYFGEGSHLGVELDYSVEEVPAGTAGSVKLLEHYLDETFLVVSGDALTDMDLGALIEFHRYKGAVATLALKRVPDPLEFGVVITAEDGRIERFLEKPTWGEVFSDTINTGDLRARARGAAPRSRRTQPFDFSKELFPRLLEAGAPLYGLVADGYWQDIGNIDPVPGGEPRRARRQGRAGDAGRAAARQRLGGRGVAGRAHRADRGPGGDRQLLRDRRDRDDRPLHGARQQRDREGVLRDRVLRGRLEHLPRPAHAGARAR